MKNSKKKIVVSVMGLTMGAALVGSISGSVAWYQYSTRASASMTATSAGTSRNLQIRDNTVGTLAADAGWGQYVSGLADNLKPITSYTTTAANAALSTYEFHAQPIYQYPTSGKTIGDAAAAKTAGYLAQYVFEFKVEDKEDGAAAALKAKPVYLGDISIAKHGTDNDLSGAIRVHIEGTENSGLLANVASTDLHGNLDIGGAAGVPDKTGIDQLDTSGDLIEYGSSNTAVQNSYAISADKTAHTFIVNDSDPYALTGGKLLGNTTTDADNPLQVTVTIWLEGWGLANSSASWAYDTYISQSVDIAMTFVTQAD